MAYSPPWFGVGYCEVGDVQHHQLVMAARILNGLAEQPTHYHSRPFGWHPRYESMRSSRRCAAKILLASSAAARPMSAELATHAECSFPQLAQKKTSGVRGGRLADWVRANQPRLGDLLLKWEVPVNARA